MQFAALDLLGGGKPALQVFLTTFLINVWFLPIETACEVAGEAGLHAAE
jgi:hypothetical protein